jgi:1,4-alpha-glucan branching enzyme
LAAQHWVFPSDGVWRELCNSDAYDRLPNLNAVGNDGRVMAEGLGWDGMPASAAITLPVNRFIVSGR